MRVSDLQVGLLSYFIGTENIHALLINQQGQAKKFRLMSCERALPLIDELFGAIEGRYTPYKAASVFRDFSCNWGVHLLPPATALNQFDILVIITHHTLHGFPFHAIRLGHDKRFLATTHGVTYSSSATLFVRCVDRNLARKTDPLKEFYLDGKQTLKQPPRHWHCFSAGVDVKHDKTDAYETLAATFASHFGSADIDKAWRFQMKHHSQEGMKLKRLNLETWETACLICHGYYDPIRADDSGLLVERIGSPLMGLSVERPIRLYGVPYHFRDLPFKYLPVEIEPRPDCQAELMTLRELKVECRTNAQLIAILGCSSAAGQILDGDDFASLAYQWLKIGAVSVLANLWEVDLQFISKWMPLFLTNWLERGQPKAIAWRQAFKQVLEEFPELSANEWSPIVLLGDWL